MVRISDFFFLGKIDNRGSRYCRWQEKTIRKSTEFEPNSEKEDIS